MLLRYFFKYKLRCEAIYVGQNCGATYVGQTKRQLKTRLKEHTNNLKQDQSKYSVISEHIIEYNHSFDWDNTKIIDRKSNFYKRTVSEMIHIKEQKVGLNLNSDSKLLDDSYFDILNEHDLLLLMFLKTRCTYIFIYRTIV